MSTQVHDVADWIGAEPRNEYDLAQIVRQGLPLQIQAVFLSHGITKD